jgi:hypothetical protein
MTRYLHPAGDAATPISTNFATRPATAVAHQRPAPLGERCMSCPYNWRAFTPTHEAAIPEPGRWGLGVTQTVIEASGPLPNAYFGCLWCRGEGPGASRAFGTTNSSTDMASRCCRRNGDPVLASTSKGSIRRTMAGRVWSSQAPAICGCAMRFVQLRCRSATRGPTYARLDAFAGGASKPGKPHRPRAKQRRDVVSPPVRLWCNLKWGSHKANIGRFITLPAPRSR